MTLHTLVQITTPRLILRPVQHGDEVELNCAVNNTLEQLQQWMPWAQDPSLNATKEFIHNGVYNWHSPAGENFPMVVIDQQSNKIISASGYNERSDLNNHSFEIGYWLDRDFQEQGLATELTNALTQYAFKVLGAKEVIIRMNTENRKSILVAERLSFIKKGIVAGEIAPDAKDFIYQRTNMDNLPNLEVAWHHISHYSSNSNDNK